MKRQYKFITLFALLMMMATACEDYLDINTDPNNPSEATVDLVFPAGISSVAFTLGGQWQILGSFWSQHWTQSTGANQYAVIDDYNITETRYDREYSELYSGALNDLNWVSQRAAEEENWNYYLMAEVMKAYTFQVLVDLYDKVPYFEALRGSEDTTPAFDDGQAIYDDLIVRIDDALSKDLDAFTSTQPGRDDMVFQGNMDNWIRFANTLKLKIYMRQTEARSQVAQAGITELFNSGAEFLDVDAEMAEYVDVEDFRNPYYAVQVSSAGNGRGNVDVAASNTLLETLIAAGDPRVNAIFNTPEAGGGHVGLDQGDYSNTGFQNHVNLSQPAIGPTHPVVFMSAAESKFLQAEAVERFGVAGDAEALYQEGIEANFEKHGVSGAAALYGAGGPYEYNGIESIIFQKWIACANFNSLESHFERLRTGYPDHFTITPNNITGGVFPRRLPYTSTELSNNAENLNAIGGQKSVIQRTWWNLAN
ncbi:MAG TPA: SusD/RagB family nutrient-binding outer membrane lipoprotein [Cyclobacteriaceae bacterium]